MKKNEIDAEKRASEGMATGRTGIIVNILLFVAKLTAGILSGSVALVSDAINNLTDSVSSVITMIGFRMSKRPADEDHPYGHARMEYVAGLIVAGVIMVTGFELVRSSIERIIKPEAPSFSMLTMIVIAVSITVKIILYVFYRARGKRLDSSLIMALAEDSRNDVFSTCAVAASIMIYYFGGVNVDGIVGLIIAGYIVYTAISVGRTVISPLLGTASLDGTRERIKEMLASEHRILGVHDLLVHDYGPGHSFATVHAEFPSDLSPVSCHEIIDRIERRALKEYNVHLLIHYDPVIKGDPVLDSLRSAAETAVKSIVPSADIHDLRLIRESEIPEVCCDVTIPYDLMKKSGDITAEIEKRISEFGKYTVSVEYDGRE